MSKLLITPRTGALALMILSIGLWRVFVTNGSHDSVLTHLTPLGAMALFGGCYFADKWKAFLFALSTIMLSDLLMGNYAYFQKWYLSGFLIPYGSFMLMVGMGTFINKVNIRNVVVAGLLSALMHWLITDFGVWADSNLYPKTWQGLITCYVAAIPYIKNMILGNLAFSALMFGVFEWAQKKYPRLQAA